MLSFRNIAGAIVLLQAAVTSVHVVAQVEGSAKTTRPIKHARSRIVPPSPPDCEVPTDGDSARHIHRAKLHKDLDEVVLLSCPLYDSAYPDNSYLLDIKYEFGQTLQKLVVQSPLNPEAFSVSLLDVTGDGYVDLIVSTDRAGGGPYVEVDLYTYDPEVKVFRRDPTFGGTSAPTLARTKGCVVTEFRAGHQSTFATRSCFDPMSYQWKSLERCSIAPDKGCRERLTR